MSHLLAGRLLGTRVEAQAQAAFPGGADFQLQSDGVCRLNPELARMLAIAAVPP